ncbi:hypothetical protein NW761_012700 [Fusarium oxysporum]|nr:hypothetical protein NW758_011616 [Fusarium oxysporum]KAJ4076620.1 hypothetical protein NW761_012700 [Fusarium oxysporum]
MLSQLRKFLKPFIKKVSEDEPRARFGHIHMPPYRFGAVSLMESNRKEFMKGDCPNTKFFVVPDLEKDLGIGLDEDDTVRPLILKFSDLLEALQATKEMVLLGEEWAYRNANMKLDGWQQHKLLPVSIMLVLYLDPRMPSACALSLIGIVKWATAISLDPDSDIRVLTMSAEKDFNFLSHVVSFTAPAMWLALGHIKHHIENAELNDGYNKSQDHLKKLVTTRQQDASAFNTEVRNILCLISEKGISVDNSESITDEGDELSSHEQYELQTHLLRAFVYHLSVIQASGINARANLMNLSTLAKSKLVVLAKLTDVKSISDEGDFVHGVSHELALRGEDNVLSNGSWTSIPGTIVARWQSGFTHAHHDDGQSQPACTDYLAQ